MQLKIGGKKQVLAPASIKGEITCSICKKKIKRGEFVAMVGKNTFFPIVAFFPGNAYGWVMGAKKYCKGCLPKLAQKPDRR